MGPSFEGPSSQVLSMVLSHHTYLELPPPQDDRKGKQQVEG